MQINETSGSKLEVRQADGSWQHLKGTHIDVHDAHAAGVNAILGGVDEVRITTVVELQVVGRRRRGGK
jgi:hypothetical protein